MTAQHSGDSIERERLCALEMSGGHKKDLTKYDKNQLLPQRPYTLMR